MASPSSGQIHQQPPAPLVPVAIAVGAGIFFERQLTPPLEMLLALLGACVIAWLLSLRRQSLMSTILLWCIAGGLAACWHRITMTWPTDAIGHVATMDRTMVRMRGVIVEDVSYHLPRRPELLSGQVTQGYSLFLCDVNSIKWMDRWVNVSGRVRVTVEGKLKHFRIGNGVELLGNLSALSPPENPGGIDLRRTWYDQHIQATLSVKTQDAITRHAESNRWSVASIMAQARAWVRTTLQAHLPPHQAGIAQALLCGEQSALSPEQFESYLQTGVYHVLAVSGQHLVILCALVGILLRFSGQDLRQRAIWLALFVLAFTLLTGARPPVVRAAAIVLAWCGALWLRRRVNPLNALALAWIVVAMINPSDLANTGCQLSFLAVLALMTIISPWYRYERDALSPLDQAEAELRTPTWKVLYWLKHQLKWAALTSLIVWLVTMPLVMQQFHLVSPVAVLLGPLLALPISIAMIAGFLLVLLGWIPLLGTYLAWLTSVSLSTSDLIVSFGKALPYSYGFWPDVPNWWVLLFYLALVAVVLQQHWLRWWKPVTLIASAWLLLIIPLTQPDVPTGLRMTVLSVGHGTAVVLETNTGKCLVYDAGSLAGPDVAHRHLANYLWHRRRNKIDEVLLSHADLDHFNALPDLLDRFRIGTLRWTPSFAQKPDRGTQATLATLNKHRVPTSVMTRGAMLETEGVAIEVLHPPAQGPAGTENARSLVLLIHYEGKRILLTGDLEEPGLSMVMANPIQPVDVLVSPHHGSRVSNTERFATWCQPKLVISSETLPRGPKPDPYTPIGATLWRTWIHGGITIEFDEKSTNAHTQLTQQVWRK